MGNDGNAGSAGIGERIVVGVVGVRGHLAAVSRTLSGTTTSRSRHRVAEFGVCSSSIPPACSRNLRTVPWRLHAIVGLAGFLSFNAFPSPRVRLPVGQSPLPKMTPNATGPHLSPLTSHLSPLTSHLSPLTSHLSPLTNPGATGLESAEK
jgi:hypothetical protein